MNTSHIIFWEPNKTIGEQSVVCNSTQQYAQIIGGKLMVNKKTKWVLAKKKPNGNNIAGAWHSISSVT
jgi:hypothetical protein